LPAGSDVASCLLSRGTALCAFALPILAPQRKLQAVVCKLHAGIVKRACQRAGTALQQSKRFGLVRREMRLRRAGGVQRKPNLHAPEIGRIEPDVELLRTAHRLGRNAHCQRGKVRRAHLR
jgi:hypothetical protein